MRDAKAHDDVVHARLRLILPPTIGAVDGHPRPAIPDAGPPRWREHVPSGPETPSPPLAGRVAEGEWSAAGDDLIDGSLTLEALAATTAPALRLDDCETAAPAPAGAGVGVIVAPSHSPALADLAAMPVESVSDGDRLLPTPDSDRARGPSPGDRALVPPVVALTGAGAFSSTHGGRRLLAFDPGRSGVRALAVVALLVFLIAGFLAWRARPRIDPVAPPPVGVTSPAPSDVAFSGGRPPQPGADVIVAVGGKVRKPGLVHLHPGARVADALQAAGGVSAGTNIGLVNLARKVVDGELIVIGVTPPPGVSVGGSGGSSSSSGPINLNAATLADLDKLPGVGPVLAQRILDARAAHGGFTSVNDLRKVEGIGDSRFKQLKDLVTV